MDLWWIFPVSIVFSTIAISSGVSGALFFSPFFMLVVGLSPAQAVGAGLLTEVFGMGNGLRLYVQQKVVDYAWARWLLAGAVPSVIVGALTGMISAGLPEISTTQLIIRCKVAPRVAVATAVFTLAITALAGATVHALSATPAWHVVQWSIPGVLVGSFLGSRVGKHLPAALMEKGLAVVFAGVGLLVISLQLVS